LGLTGHIGSIHVHKCSWECMEIHTLHNDSHCRFKEIIRALTRNWFLKWLKFDRPLDYLNLHKSNHDYEVLKDELFFVSCWTNKHLNALKLYPSTLYKIIDTKNRSSKTAKTAVEKIYVHCNDQYCAVVIFCNMSLIWW